nr:hypothetical protein SHINE37_41322 [Rhizobiaceae bacterium]
MVEGKISKNRIIAPVLLAMPSGLSMLSESWRVLRAPGSHPNTEKKNNSFPEDAALWPQLSLSALIGAVSIPRSGNSSTMKPLAASFSWPLQCSPSSPQIRLSPGATSRRCMPISAR